MSVIASLIGFNILIVVHELGHYLAARLVGLRAERVSIGMGPTLAAWSGAHTEYRLAILPLGGYVRFPSNQSVHVGRRSYADDGLRELSHWQRVWVVSAGPIANVCLAILIYGSLFATDSAVVHRFKRTDSNHLGAVTQRGTLLGVQTGDFIVAVNGRRTESFAQVLRELSQTKTSAMLELARSSTPNLLQFEKRNSSLEGLAQYWPVPPAEVTRVQVKLNDRAAIKAFLADVQPTVIRWGSTSTPSAVWHGIDEVLSVLKAMMGLFEKWVEGTAEPQLRSVVGMTQLSAASYERGWHWFLSLLALFSMNLAVLNFLPLPGLDGGRLLLDVLEWSSGRPLPANLVFWIHGVGMSIILLLIVFVMASESIELLR